MNSLNIKTNTVTRTVTTKTLELEADQVEAIVRNWAKKSQGFADPEIETHCSWDGMFTGMTLTETVTDEHDDSDTRVEGD